MIIKLLGITLGVYLLVLIYNNYNKYQNWFYPTVIFPILEFLSHVIGLIVLTHESSIVFTVDGTLTVCFYEFIYVSIVMLAMRMFAPRDNTINYNVRNISIIKIIICFAIGLWAKAAVFAQLGGLAFVVENGQEAYHMQAHGYGIYITLYKFMLIAIIAILDKYFVTRNRGYFILSVLLIAIYILSYLVYTNRTPALIMILIIMAIVNFEWSRIKIKSIFKPQFVILFGFILFASNYATNSRTSSGDLVEDESIIVDMIRNLSTEGREMFIYEHFNKSNFLWGTGYRNILPALNPFETDKPSLDDGIYLVNLMNGHNVDISARTEYLPIDTGSVPFSTPSYMYANFGFIGLLIAGLLMGWIYMFSYRLMIKRMNAFNITIYFYVIYSFGLSTGRMVPTIITIVFILLGQFFMGGRKVVNLSQKQ